MNIFKILSSNDGHINEPSISSYLAYLLDYNEDHGLSELLLQSIISDFKKEPNNFEKLNMNNLLQYDIEIKPEYSVYFGKDEHRYIDIVVEFCEKGLNRPIYSICIENKIADSSIQKKQLKEELEGLQNEYSKNNYKTEIYFCFITLEKSKKSNDEFNSFDYERKLHLYWKGENSIEEKLLDILKKESNVEIEPIPEESKFLIKSFITFIHTNFKSRLEEKEEKNQRTDYGKPTREHFIDFIAKYEFNKDYKKKEIMQNFSKYIKEKCHKDINKNQLACLMYEITANEKNRIYYTVREDNYESKNILYYPDVSNKKVLRRYPENEKEREGIEVWYKEKWDQYVRDCSTGESVPKLS